MKRVLYIGLLLLVGLLTLEGCIKEDNPAVAETRNISTDDECGYTCRRIGY